jgi:hypothetical protein
MISERFRQFRVATWPLARPALGLGTIRIGLCLSLWLCARAMGAEYWVAPDGDDSGPGTSDQPWRTIQQGANRAQPGDVIRVRTGTYPERVTTVRGGTSEQNRIVFEAVGPVVMRGWVINHPYVSVRGFDITGHSAPSNLEAYVRVNNGGSYFELTSCVIRDGMAIKQNDMMFRSPNRIESAAGNFLEAGFQVGQTISVWRGTNIALSNRLSYVIASVEEHALTIVGTDVVDDGPKPAYITGSANYGLLLGSGTQGCLIRSNRFSNLSYRYVFIQGLDHLLECNVFDRNNGWDLLFWSGTNHVVRSNLFINLGWGVYEPSPDVFDNWPVRYENIHFTHNMVVNMIGVINAQKRNATASGPLYIRHNVFVDVGWLGLVMPNCVIEHNTFLRVAKQGNVAVQVERHPLIINSDNYATNCIVRNNVFVDCGQATGQVRPDQVGWYRFTGPIDSALVEGNFVAGGPPDFAPKTSWPESPALNGGDPGFLNIDDPLGPDGWPFTEDDGLQLRPDSRLIGAGPGGATPGAYGPVSLPPVQLEIAAGVSPGQIRLQWPVQPVAWRLETATSLQGPWDQLTNSPSLRDNRWEILLEADQPARFFRLRR